METVEEILDKYWQLMMADETSSYELRQCILDAMKEYGRLMRAEGYESGKYDLKNDIISLL